VAVVLVWPSEVRLNSLTHDEELACHAGYPIACPKIGPDMLSTDSLPGTTHIRPNAITETLT
jgi:hypothetical protein